MSSNPSFLGTSEDVICCQQGVAGEILLNRPKALNALTEGMVAQMLEALLAWATDPSVHRVVIRSLSEKAFCAGGDIRQMYQLGRAGQHQAQLAFWHTEYQLNRLINRYPKPFVALLDGIVMGGGAGLSIHGSHRVVGDKTLFAMPEVGIGLFPDVGAGWFLPRLPGAAGLWLGLTGTRLGAGDMVALGLAQTHVPSAQLEALATALRTPGDTDAIVARFAVPAPGSAVDLDLITGVFVGDTLAAVLDNLSHEGSQTALAWHQNIVSGSPTSALVTFHQLQQGRDLVIEDVMRMEYRIVSRIVTAHDFYEGVRAVIVDKDQRPIWSPASLEMVDPAAIAAYFEPLGDTDMAFAPVPGITP